MSLWIAALIGTTGTEDPADLLRLTRLDVVVATVRRVSTHPATNGRPPLVELEIRELLRGDPRLDRRRAIWSPLPRELDGVGGDVVQRIQEWSASPLAAPFPGSRFILVGELRGSGPFRVSALGRFPDTPERRAWVRSLLREPVAVSR